ncbi:MAG TPA: hypothetical protein VH063_17475 [Gaiellaceae bacterium]|jgi:hypothetical protein|nr:hypothetical protein [Gaiellaceae bacterium]
MQTHTLATLAVAVAVGSGFCGASTAAQQASAAPIVTVTMTSSGPTLSGARTWRPGAERIAVRSRVADQEATLLHFRAGYTYAKFVADGRRARGNSVRARAALRRIFAYTVFDGGLDLFQGQAASFTVTVGTGTYYLGEMTTRPQLTPIHVVGPSLAGRSPSTARVTATDSGYLVPAHALPAHGTITIRNSGNRPHRLNFIPLAPGTTRAQLGAYLRKTGARDNAAPPPFALSGPQFGTADLSGNQDMQVTYTLPEGTYALIDFDEDMTTGRPEALEGMYAIATLG